MIAIAHRLSTVRDARPDRRARRRADRRARDPRRAARPRRPVRHARRARCRRGRGRPDAELSPCGALRSRRRPSSSRSPSSRSRSGSSTASRRSSSARTSWSRRACRASSSGSATAPTSTRSRVGERAGRPVPRREHHEDDGGGAGAPSSRTPAPCASTTPCRGTSRPPARRRPRRDPRPSRSRGGSRGLHAGSGAPGRRASSARARRDRRPAPAAHRVRLPSTNYLALGLVLEAAGKAPLAPPPTRRPALRPLGDDVRARARLRRPPPRTHARVARRHRRPPARHLRPVGPLGRWCSPRSRRRPISTASSRGSWEGSSAPA